jgi:O-antigen/teichoic acid export membrane protein
MRRLLDFLGDRAILGAGLSLAVKTTGSGAAVVMFALAARTMPIVDFGLLVIVFNIVSFLAVLAVLGQETLILRTWGEFVERSPATAHGALIWSLSIAGCGAVLATACFALWASFVDRRLDLVDVAAAAALLLTQTLVLYMSSLTRVVRGILFSEPHRELTWRLPLVLALGWALVSGHRTSFAEFFAIAAAGQSVALFLQAGAIRRGLPEPVGHAHPTFLIRPWTRLGATLTSSAIVDAANQYADVVILGALAGPVVSAGWFVAIRVANVFGMLTSGLHSYTASRAAALYFAGNVRELQHLLNRVMALALVLVAGILVLIVVLGPWILSLFGEAFRAQYPLLLVLSCITAFATLAGPGALVMLTTGREKLYLKLVTAALIGRVVTLAVAVPFLGLWGGAVAAAIAIVPPVIVITWVCIRSIGVDPSVLGLLHRPIETR